MSISIDQYRMTVGLFNSVNRTKCEKNVYENRKVNFNKIRLFGHNMKKFSLYKLFTNTLILIAIISLVSFMTPYEGQLNSNIKLNYHNNCDPCNSSAFRLKLCET